MDSYMRHSWHRTHFGSHSRKFDMPESSKGQDDEEALYREMKSGRNLTGGNFQFKFDAKIGAFPTFAHRGHYTNIQMQVDRYPRARGCCMREAGN
jgi:hypothetical protein